MNATATALDIAHSAWGDPLPDGADANGCVPRLAAQEPGIQADQQQPGADVLRLRRLPSQPLPEGEGFVTHLNTIGRVDFILFGPDRPHPQNRSKEF